MRYKCLVNTYNNPMSDFEEQRGTSYSNTRALELK